MVDTAIKELETLRHSDKPPTPKQKTALEYAISCLRGVSRLAVLVSDADQDIEATED